MPAARNSLNQISMNQGRATVCNAKTIKQKTALLVAYQRAVDTYTAAVVELVKRCDVTHQLDHRKFRLIVELADRASSNAKERLKRHVAEHK